MNTQFSCRIPISPDRPIEDSYLDAYLRVIKSTDPLHTSLVFSCGMGAVRTTYAMVAACVVRRKQIMRLQARQQKFVNLGVVIGGGVKDPFGIEPKDGTRSPPGSGFATPVKSTSGGTDTPSGILQSLEQASAQVDLSRSLLRLMYLLQQCLEPSSAHHPQFPSSTSAFPFGTQPSSTSSAGTPSANLISLLITHPTLLDSLRKAYLGNYGVILSLLGCLEDGLGTKRVVDRVIDANDHVVNLRESILVQRVKYALSSSGSSGEGAGAGGEASLTRAGKALEKYFFMIAFASFVEGSDEGFSQSFSEWLIARTEIWK